MFFKQTFPIYKMLTKFYRFSIPELSSAHDENARDQQAVMVPYEKYNSLLLIILFEAIQIFLVLIISF